MSEGYIISNEVLQKPAEKYWISYLRQRIKRNKNFLGIIFGPPGIGKSWTCLSIAEQIDPHFSISQVVFTPQEFMRLMNSDKLQKGSVIVFEEAGVSMSNKNWHSAVNKMFNFVMQTFRHRNYIVLFNCPYTDFIDSSTRKLFHAEIEVRGIRVETAEAVLKPLLLQYNSQKGKYYVKFLRVATAKGVRPVKTWAVQRPSQNIIDMYEPLKAKFTARLNKSVNEDLAQIGKRVRKGKKSKENRV